MKFSEKAEDVPATVKTPLNQALRRDFVEAEKAQKMAENVGKSPSLFPAFTGLFRNQFRKKILLNPLV